MAKAQLITFYSFKGGVGRTMAMANVACQLANKHGRDVIAVDWDLEAPGLHYYFDFSDEEISERKGLLDYLEDFRTAVRQRAAGSEPVLDDYLVELKPAIRDRLKFGRVRLMPCGCTDARYMERVQAFNWSRFYAEDHGFEIIETLKHRLRAAAEISLIDARAGQADVGTTPTLQVPDAVVLLFTSNRQNLRGMAEMARRLYYNADRKAMGFPPVRLLLIPSRVFVTGRPFERWLTERADPVYRRLLDDGVVRREDQPKALRQCYLPVDPDFAFDESLPVLEQRPRRGTLHAAYAALAEAVDDLYQDLPVWGRQPPDQRPAEYRSIATAELESALRRAKERQDRHQEAGLNLTLGIEALERNDLGEAKARLRAAHQYFKSRGDHARESRSLFYLGRVNSARGRYEEAWDLFQRALGLYEQAGDVRTQGVTLHEMGNVRRYEGRLDEAWDLLQRALALKEQAVDIRGQGVTLSAMARVRLLQRRLDDAEPLLDRALDLARSTGGKATEAFVLLRQAEAALARGDRAAESLLEQALALSSEIRSVGERSRFDQEVEEVRQGLAALNHDD